MTRLCFAVVFGLMVLYLGAAGAWAQEDGRRRSPGEGRRR